MKEDRYSLMVSLQLAQKKQERLQRALRERGVLIGSLWEVPKRRNVAEGGEEGGREE